MYRNWNSDGPAMPAVFEDTEFRPGKNRPWNFGKYTPDIVSIALGTNDFSNGDGRHQRLPFDSVAFVAAYEDFVNLVKSKYPEARIVLLNSPMVGGERALLLRRGLDSVKRKVDMSHKEDYPVSLFFFNPMQGHGCSGHPSVEDHAILAKEVAPFFKSLLNGL
jgi:hypothetical protein